MVPGEPGAAGAQHEPVDPLGVTLLDELGDRPTHRVADGHEPVDAARGQGRRRRRRRLEGTARSTGGRGHGPGDRGPAPGSAGEGLGAARASSGRRSPSSRAGGTTGAPGGPATARTKVQATNGEAHVAPGRQPRCSAWLSDFPPHRNPSWSLHRPSRRRPWIRDSMVTATNPFCPTVISRCMSGRDVVLAGARSARCGTMRSAMRAQVHEDGSGRRCSPQPTRSRRPSTKSKLPSLISASGPNR